MKKTLITLGVVLILLIAALLLAGPLTENARRMFAQLIAGYVR